MFQSCFFAGMSLSIIVTLSVLEDAFRLLLRFVQFLFNFSSLTSLCCLCYDSSYIHDPFVLHFLLLFDFSPLEASPSYSPFMLSVLQDKEVCTFLSPTGGPPQALLCTPFSLCIFSSTFQS